MFFISVKSLDRFNFTFSHDAAVTLYVRTEDGSELAFKFFCCHGILQRLVGSFVEAIWSDMSLLILDKDFNNNYYMEGWVPPDQILEKVGPPRIELKGSPDNPATKKC